MRAANCVLIVAAATFSACSPEHEHVGPSPSGGSVVPTMQRVSPPGDTLEIAGRPVDLALSPDGRRLFAKTNTDLIAIDTAAWKITAQVAFPGEDGGSMTGLVVTPDGTRILASTAGGLLCEAGVRPDGSLEWFRSIKLPAHDKGSSFPCGIALSADGSTAYVCLSRNNSLGVVDLDTGKLTSEIAVGIAPYEVRLSATAQTAYVSNWGGRHPTPADLQAFSANVAVKVDARGIAASGTLSVVDLAARRESQQVDVGLSPGALTIVPGSPEVVAVASANSDTVTFVSGKESRSLSIRPSSTLPSGSMPNGVAALGTTMYVSNAGNNAIAVYRTTPTDPLPVELVGLIPTAWYPGPIIATPNVLYVACIKGVGSRTPQPPQRGWNSHWHRGTITRLAVPNDRTLRDYTTQAHADGLIEQGTDAPATSVASDPPTPMPDRPGQPSVFEHVVYIIKENRTFDQVLGDMGRGNADPSLCIFGREITPNQHALADEFTLLDNYYCNGVLSADGHSWATEGNVTPYLERSFGGFKRSYTFGDDPLTYSSSGFIWDHVLAAGFSFQNFGEFDEAGVSPPGTYFDVLENFQKNDHRFTFTHSIGVANVRTRSHPQYPGWNLAIPDVQRAAIFLKALGEYERSGDLPNFITIYLPDDHTAGVDKTVPTPRSMVADNDLALGQIVEGLTRSRFWATTCVFVIEDDPQNGFDHVDGHRSTCQVISPYTRRHSVVSNFYNQSSVVHSIQRIFGVAAQNQLSAIAPVMRECFTDTPDFTPYTHRPNIIPLGERNPVKTADAEENGPSFDFSAPDLADEDTLNRVIWSSVRGDDTEYPVKFAGAHGTGLAVLGLRLDESQSDDDDDD